MEKINFAIKSRNSKFNNTHGNTLDYIDIEKTKILQVTDISISILTWILDATKWKRNISGKRFDPREPNKHGAKVTVEWRAKWWLDSVKGGREEGLKTISQNYFSDFLGFKSRFIWLLSTC